MPRPITPRHVLRFAISVLILLFTFALATDAQASTDSKPDYTPVDIWEASWEDRISLSPLTPDMVDEWGRIEYLAENESEPEPAPVVVQASVRLPTPPTPPPSRVHPSGVEQWRSLVELHFQPEDVAWAMRVMACESGGDPYAANPRSSARGLFQFLKGWYLGTWGYPAFDPFDPEANVTAAAWLLYNSGAQNWECK